MKCYCCETPLIWHSDFDFEDYDLDGIGIVTILDCPNEDCNVNEIRVYQSASNETL